MTPDTYINYRRACCPEEATFSERNLEKSLVPIYSNPIASICAVAMMVNSLGEEEMGKAIDNAVVQTTPKLKSLSAGQMGYSTSQVGDLVVEAL